MKKIFLIAIISVAGFSIQAQIEEPEKGKSEVFTIVSEFPKFLNCPPVEIKSVAEYECSVLQSHIKDELAKKGLQMNPKYPINITAVISKTGSVSSVSLSMNDLSEKEESLLKEVLLNLPRGEPGMMNEKPVNVRVQFTFKG